VVVVVVGSRSVRFLEGGDLRMWEGGECENIQGAPTESTGNPRGEIKCPPHSCSTWLRRADIFNICARGAGKVGALLYLYVMYDSRDMRFPRDIVEARG